VPHCRVQNGIRVVGLRLKCDGTRAETRFRLSAKRTSPFKSVGASVQSTTDSRSVRISGSNGRNAGYTMFRGSVKSTGYPLHSPVSPSLPLPASPCAITFQPVSTTWYSKSLNLQHSRWVYVLGWRICGLPVSRLAKACKLCRARRTFCCGSTAGGTIMQKFVLTAVQDAVKWHATVCFPQLGQLCSGLFGLLPWS